MNTTTKPSSDYGKRTVPNHDALDLLREQARAVGYELRELGRVGLETAQDELANRRHQGEAALDDAKDRVNEFEHELVDRVRRNPLRALAYAAGAGLALGLYLRR